MHDPNVVIARGVYHKEIKGTTMRINPDEYKADIDFMFCFHNISSILNTAALITLSWFSYSPNSPLTQQHPDKKKFYAISCSIAVGLLILPIVALYLTLSPFVDMFKDSEDIKVDQNNKNENLNRIKNIIREHNEVFRIAVTPEIQIIQNDIENMITYQLTPCTAQHLSINSGCINSDLNNTFSLQITLAHEMMHLEYDQPSLSAKRFEYGLYALNILFLCFGYTPFQIGFSIAGAITAEFQASFVYLPLIGLFLAVINVLSLFQLHRTIERAADYHALFGGKKFENEEYNKQRQYYAAFPPENSWLSTLFNTHPSASERMALLIAAEEHVPHNSVELVP